MNISCTASHCHLRLQVLIEVGVSFSNSALSPLYIPSWPPGEHLLSGVASRAGKCKIRPADERLTIISIHNGSKICQIFPDLNIPEVLQRSRILHSQRGEDSRLLRIPKRFESDCGNCCLLIGTIVTVVILTLKLLGGCLPFGLTGEPTQYASSDEKHIDTEAWDLISFSMC